MIEHKYEIADILGTGRNDYIFILDIDYQKNNYVCIDLNYGYKTPLGIFFIDRSEWITKVA